MEVVLGLYKMVSNPYFIDTVILFILARAVWPLYGSTGLRKSVTLT